MKLVSCRVEDGEHLCVLVKGHIYHLESSDTLAIEEIDRTCSRVNILDVSGNTNQAKTGIVARVGGDWNCRVTDYIFSISTNI